MSEAAAIEVARRPAIESVLGGGDLRLMIEQARENVAVAIEIARGRGFVTDYEVKDRSGAVIGKRAFFHLQTWQLLAHAWGLTVLVEGEPTEVKPGTWQASAVVQTIETAAPQGRAVALCARSEPGKKYKSDHDLSATAQSRAARNAIRYTLGDLLIAAGFDFADPDAPATKEQTKAIWTLAGKNGWDRDEAHERAGVDSMKDLTRETAAELIDEWSTLAEGAPGSERSQDGADARPGTVEVDPDPGASSDAVTPAEEPEVGEEAVGASPASSSAEPAHDPDEPASPKQWDNALKLKKLTKNKILLRARALWPEAGITQAAQITHGQLAQIIDEAMA
jgi:hypothetical protein